MSQTLTEASFPIHISTISINQETVSRDFQPSFFLNQTILLRALINGQKSFRIWLRIRRDIRDNVLQRSGLMTPQESSRK
jgi:hypothetical protein